MEKIFTKVQRVCHDDALYNFNRGGIKDGEAEV
jgi:hypothetical protein